MTGPRWSEEAWRAWDRYDAPQAVAIAIAAFDEAHDSSEADEALVLACYFTVRAHRPDLIASHRESVKRLERSVIRDAALILLAFVAADLGTAVALSTKLHDSPPNVALVTDQDSDEAMRADILITAATAAVSSGVWPIAQHLLYRARQSIDVDRPAGHTSPHVWSWLTRAKFDLLGLEAVAEYHTHLGEETYRTLRDALEPLRRSNQLSSEHALALIGLAGVQHLRGELSAAALTLQRAFHLAGSNRPGVAAHARIELAFIRARQGRMADVEQLAAVSRIPDVSAGASWFPPQVAAIRALAAALHGDYVTAREESDEAAAQNAVVSSYLAAMVITHTRVLTAIGLQDWRRLGWIVEDAGDPGFRHPYRENEWRALELAAAWARDRHDDAAVLLEQWAGAPGAETDPYRWTFVSVYAKRAGDSTAAARAATRALTLLGPDHDPAGARIVRAVLAGGRVDPAREVTTTVGAPLVETPPVETDPTEADLAALPQLTRQQRTVAAAVARGFTSSEIAVMMHLSKRTVDYHVANIMHQFGLSSRREISRILTTRTRPPGP